MFNNWQEDNIQNLCEIVNGKTPLRSNNEYWLNGDIPWFTIDDQRKQGKIIYKTNQFITQKALEKSGVKLVPKNSVLICCTASVGEYAITKIPLTTNQQFNSLIIKNTDEIIPEYLFHYSSQIVNKLLNLMGKTTFGFVSVGQLGSIKIKYPDLKTQQKIALILSTVDEEIQKTEEIIKKTEQLKDGLMNELLTKGIGHTKFKKTKIGEIPEDWKIIKLSEISYITKLAGYEFTKYFNSYKETGEIIVIRGLNLKNGKLDLTDIKTISKVISDNLIRSKLKSGDLVFSYVGTVGPIALISEENKFHLGPNVCKISPNINLINQKYLYHYFLSNLITNEINKKISVTAQPSLSMEKIRDFEIILPIDLKEQLKIVEILDNIDLVLNTYQKNKIGLLNVKNGLMDDIFSQKVGVLS